MQYIRIKNLRIDHDVKQIEIAHHLGVSQNTYSDYELGKINVPVDIIIKIADYYNVSTDYILNRTDNPNILQRSMPKYD